MRKLAVLLIATVAGLGSSARAQFPFDLFGSPDPGAAARFLQQATFGPTTDEIEALAESDAASWIDAQIALAPTTHFPRAAQLAPRSSAESPVDFRIEAWWETVLSAPDQLRQRVAFALSEIFVISDTDSQLARRQLLMTDYYDILVRNALGNYRELLEQVTLSPAMGLFLSHLGNDRPDPRSGRRPDENYAREVMQLFSIGLWKLKDDGSPVLDPDGEQIPTYDQNIIEGYAHVYTGWTWGHVAGFTRNSMIEDEIPAPYTPPIQMQLFPDHHAREAKRLLDGTFIPALPAAQPMTAAIALDELRIALDSIFDHPNVPPFIARQLIIKLVTSNPSPAYIERVAEVFKDDGNGVRGNLAAVVRAILLDDESRLGSAALPHGKLKEPILRLAQLLRAFGATSASGIYGVGRTTAAYGQAALRAPSVFNFFSPNYQYPGVIRDQGLYAPEFQLQTESRGISIVNDLAGRIERADDPAAAPDEVVISLAREAALDGDEALISHLDVLLFGGRMSDELDAALRAALATVAAEPAASFGLRRAQAALLLAATAPEFAVQRGDWAPAASGGLLPL